MQETGCIINEQVILQDQEGVLAWVSERLAVAMRQAEDKDNVLDKPILNNWKLSYNDTIRNSMDANMRDNQREELSYLAGLFDGEGTVCIQKDTRPIAKNNGRNWNPIYNVTFRIGMIERDAIESFRKFFNVGYVDCEKVYHAFRPMWRYSARTKGDVKMIISTICPFLRVKAKQAHLALDYFEDCPSQRGTYLTPEILAKKEWYYQEMRRLNGVDNSPATTKRMGRALSVRVSDSLNS